MEIIDNTRCDFFSYTLCWPYLMQKTVVRVHGCAAGTCEVQEGATLHLMVIKSRCCTRNKWNCLRVMSYNIDAVLSRGCSLILFMCSWNVQSASGCNCMQPFFTAVSEDIASYRAKEAHCL